MADKIKKSMVLLISDEKIVIGNKGNKWDLIKGSIKPNETPQMCASRELLEETGLSLTPTFLYEDSKSNFFVFYQDINISSNSLLSVELGGKVEFIEFRLCELADLSIFLSAKLQDVATRGYFLCKQNKSS